VDAGAAAAIHKALVQLAKNGAAVLIISQDLEELLAISDRIAVIANGRLSEPVDTARVTMESIGRQMGGMDGQPQPASSPEQNHASH
jgi:general nucleoside transport system ATP-binding protein